VLFIRIKIVVVFVLEAMWILGEIKMKEYQFLEFKKNKQTYKEIESVLKEKSAMGWEVISMTIDVSVDLRGIVVILLQRETK
jgi:hypothetical protein